MEESDLSKCSECGRIEVRKHAGSFDGKNKKFVDAQGKLWNGRKCPSCHKNKVKTQIKEKRLNAKSGDEPKN
jgi:hypothetical protein